MSRGFQKVPKPLGTPEWASFLNYVMGLYDEAVSVSVMSALSGLANFKDLGTKSDLFRIAFQVILDKTCSPLVFVWEEWQIMTPAQKMRYATPEYVKELEKIKAQAEKVKEQARTAT